ncbi:MAG: DUF58 domain-containing protein [Proteobacteria bacterium]|nr:DUF58 domain-containing protein [Pseudomonadota bacterium]
MLVALALVPLAVLCAPVPGLGFAFVAAAGALLGAFLFDGLRYRAETFLEVERELPRSLSVGEAATIRLRVRNHASVPLEITVADGCGSGLGPEVETLELTVPPHAVEHLEYTVLPVSRGIHRFEPLEVRIRRRLGLAEHQAAFDLPDEARVHPNLRNLARYELRARRDLLHAGGARRTRILGRDGDFERLRDFVPGDDIRHVDWKATARLQRPITRVYQAERAQNLLVLIDATRLMAARAAGLAKLDFAVNAALMLSFVALTRGDKVGVAVFDHGIRAYLAPQAGPQQFGRILDLLFDQQPVRKFPRYREAARAIVAHNRRRSLVVWLTDLLDGEQGRELLGALRALRRRHLSLVVAMDDPDVHTLASTWPKDSQALFTAAAASEILDERAALIRRLLTEGAHVVDQRPEDITAAVVDRYLELKQRGAL